MKVRLSLRPEKNGNVRLKSRRESISLTSFQAKALLKSLAMSQGQSVLLRRSRASYVFGSWGLVDTDLFEELSPHASNGHKP